MAECGVIHRLCRDRVGDISGLRATEMPQPFVVPSTGGRVLFGEIEIDNLAVFMSQPQEHVEDPKGDSGYGERSMDTRSLA